MITLSSSFIHPTDKNWPSKREREKSSRSAPLVPQSDLFLRSQSADFSNGRNEHSSSRDSRFTGIKYKVRVNNQDNERGPEKKGKERDSNVVDNVKIVAKDTKSVTMYTSVAEMSPRKSQQLVARVMGQGTDDSVAGNSDHNHPTGSPSGKIEWSCRITHLFQELARISRESDQFLQVQKKEECKAETYKRISSSLKNITASAENTFASQLARSLQTHEDCTNFIEKNNQSCQKIWTETMVIISEEAKRVVDAHLRVALDSIKTEAEKGVSVISSGIKRKRMDGNDALSDFLPETPPISALHGLDAFKGEEEASRDIKRKRLGPSSTTPPDWIEGPEDKNLEQVDLIKQLKLHVDKQKQILLTLTKENNELRAALRMDPVQKL